MTTGTEKQYPGYGFNFEEKLTKKDPEAPSDAGSFRVILKVGVINQSTLPTVGCPEMKKHFSGFMTSFSTGSK
ncbi:MAG: hypothetical protein ABJO54_07395 [Hyphomicrobiales bacterium]